MKAARVIQTFGAFEVDEDGRSRCAAFWCPACGAVHAHGGAGGFGNRGSHCNTPRSPWFGTGYNLERIGKAPSFAALTPAAAPFAGLHALPAKFDKASAALRKEVLRCLLGVKRPGTWTFKELKLFIVSVFDLSSCSIEPKNGPPRKGRDLLTLAADLYGSTPGIAGLMLLEASTSAQFDSDTAQTIARAIDAWRANGSPSRTGVEAGGFR